MTQFQFDLICKLVEAGAPVLSKELCEAMSGLVQTLNTLVNENEKLKAQLEKANEPEEIIVDGSEAPMVEAPIAKKTTRTAKTAKTEE
jgi:hypothetical protein